MLKRLNPLPAGRKPKGLNHINIRKQLSLETKHEMVQPSLAHFWVCARWAQMPQGPANSLTGPMAVKRSTVPQGCPTIRRNRWQVRESVSPSRHSLTPRATSHVPHCKSLTRSCQRAREKLIQFYPPRRAPRATSRRPRGPPATSGALMSLIAHVNSCQSSSGQVRSVRPVSPSAQVNSCQLMSTYVKSVRPSTHVNSCQNSSPARQLAE